MSRSPFLSLISCFITSSVVAAEVVSFEKEVLPVLKQRCFECHGEKKQKSGLRADSRAALLKGGDFGAAVIPGDAVSSHLIEVITTNDKDSRMPPKGERLSASEVEALKRWIAQGAVWPGQMDAVAQAKVTSDHWSFQPLAKFSGNESIDGFIRAKLAEKGLKPSPEADRRTLIRRVSLDLTGLPPPPDEVEAFVNDKDARAYEKVVERLLSSPRYGERWAQHWLDVIRYADTRGYEYNTLRENTWPFRDWVIEALNKDLPYDQFLFQQIAGDTLGVDPATGFLVTAPLPTPAEVGEEPAAIKQARFNALDEVVQNVGASMLGLTVGCARCHNHKFDPIPSRDYYRMVSVFSGLQYDNRPWRVGPETERLAELKRAEQRLTATRRGLGKFPHWREVNEGRYSDHFTAVNAKWVRLTVTATDATSEGPAFDEIEVWTAGQPGVAPINVALAERGGKATSSGAAKQLGSQDAFLNDRKFGNDSTWVANKRPEAWVQIELARPCVINQIIWSRDRPLAKTNPAAHAKRLTSVWRIEVAEKEGEWRTVVSESRSNGLDVTAMQERRYIEKELHKLNGSLPALRQGPTVFAGTFTQPELINVLMRGDPQQPRDPVGPGGLEILHGVELSADTPESERRVAFAKWIANKDNPLTARVAVNRVWHHHFGNGLVDTPGDFGTMGSRPTHPELLDWLASEFITRGWSLKELHRMIVTSATYRRASEIRNPKSEIDPQSRYLWRFPPRRLDAEAIRDSILSITGVLDLKMGGIGVNIYQPKGNFDQWKPLENPGPESWRRMIYLAKMRGADDGMFKTFDLPDCGQVRAKRGESTTPLQALNLINGSFTIEQAQRLADRAQREAGADPGKQIERLFALAFARPPSTSERNACLASAQTEGLVTVCRALINSNEFLFLQ
ncbi:MAG: PSD1 and planctomycete cytochrome C domain-containing protein [Limisphaerales bacterium]